MKCAIMQPTYLPWPGYFNLIANVDVFIFLDDVKIEKQSWQTRNRIFGKKEPLWLTVPIKGSRLQDIQSCEINDQISWRKKHLQSLKQTYSKHPFGEEALEIVSPIIEDLDLKNLSKINQSLILSFCKAFQFSPIFMRSSELKKEGKRSERLVNLLKGLGCKHYISPKGSKEYIAQDGLFPIEKILVTFQNFEFSPYSQKGEQDFQEMLSTVDLVANLGVNGSANWILNGWKSDIHAEKEIDLISL